MKIWKTAGALALLVPLALAGLTPTAAAAETDCADFSVSVSRLVSPQNGSALLTQFASEISSATNYGFEMDNATAMLVASASNTAHSVVWRVYNASSRDFSWALEGSDLQAMEKRGYAKQFKQFSVSTSKSECTSPVYRLGRSDSTRLAVGTGERDLLVKDGWTVVDSSIFFAAGETAPPNSPAKPQPPAQETEQNAANADSFTVAVIPDTQQEVWSDSDTRFKERSTWLVDNAAAKNIKFVTHIGDVVDWGNVSPMQYTRAKAALAPLNGKLPYSLTIGNHDTAAVCQGGSACAGVSANVALRDTAVFNAAFPLSSFSSIKGQYEPGKVDNTYSTFAAGGQKWMVLNLELWPRQGAIDWAKKIVAANPDHNVIVSTHSYLDADGSIGTTNGGYGATAPKHLFDTFIKVYPNIKVVLSGHTGGAASRVDTGVNGNKILSLLQCFHSRTTNPVRLLTINVADGSIKTSVYAPRTKETLVAEQTVTGFSFKR